MEGNGYVYAQIPELKYHSDLTGVHKTQLFVLSLVFMVFSNLLPSSVSGMKRPFSQSFVPNPELEPSGVGTGPLEEMDMESCCNIQEDSPAPGGQSPGGALHSSLHRPKRERKQRTYTLCEVCNIQLNSSAQAQIHYNGKSHQKRLKKIRMPGSTGRASGGSWLLFFLLLQNKT